MLYNNLTEVQEELIGLLQEEAAEVIQELSKLRRTGTNFCRKGGSIPNEEFFAREIEDFRILLMMAHKVGLISSGKMAAYRSEKLERLKQWTNLPHDLIESI